jgi:hypothetical protein
MSYFQDLAIPVTFDEMTNALALICTSPLRFFWGRWHIYLPPTSIYMDIAMKMFTIHN